MEGHGREGKLQTRRAVEPFLSLKVVQNFAERRRLQSPEVSEAHARTDARNDCVLQENLWLGHGFRWIRCNKWYFSKWGIKARRRDDGLENRVPPCRRHSLAIIEGFTLISSAKERLDSSWQSSGAVEPYFVDVASPAPSSARPLD
jgi:hypothetical protein